MWAASPNQLGTPDPGDTLAVAGRMPGIYLLSDSPVRALVPYTLTPFTQPARRRMSYDYYARPDSRPTLVMVYRDPHFPFIDPFAKWNSLRERLPTPLGSLEIFRRTDLLRAEASRNPRGW